MRIHISCSLANLRRPPSNQTCKKEIIFRHKSICFQLHFNVTWWVEAYPSSISKLLRPHHPGNWKVETGRFQSPSTVKMFAMRMNSWECSPHALFVKRNEKKETEQSHLQSWRCGFCYQKICKGWEGSVLWAGHSQSGAINAFRIKGSSGLQPKPLVQRARLWMRIRAVL